MKRFKLHFLMVCVLILLVVGVADAQDAPLTVWHALGEAEAGFVDSVIGDYGGEYGGAVEAIWFDSPQALYDQLLVTDPADQPDIYFLDHTWERQLAENGLADYYCAPEGMVEGGAPIGNLCEVCMQPNPPEICWYANTSMTQTYTSPVCMMIGDCWTVPENEMANTYVFWDRFGGRFGGGVIINGIPAWWNFTRVVSDGSLTGLTDREVMRLAVDAQGLYMVQGMFISPYTDQPEAAVEFGYLFGEPEVQLRLFEATGNLPTNVEALNQILG